MTTDLATFQARLAPPGPSPSPARVPATTKAQRAVHSLILAVGLHTAAGAIGVNSQTALRAAHGLTLQRLSRARVERWAEDFGR